MRSLSVLVLLALMACEAPMAPLRPAPVELSCSNVAVAPDYILVPHRLADSTRIYNRNPPHQEVAVIVYTRKDGGCVTHADSLRWHPW